MYVLLTQVAFFNSSEEFMRHKLLVFRELFYFFYDGGRYHIEASPLICRSSKVLDIPTTYDEFAFLVYNLCLSPVFLISLAFFVWISVYLKSTVFLLPVCDYFIRKQILRLNEQ